MTFDLSDFGEELVDILRDNGEDPEIEGVHYVDIIERLVRCYRKVATEATERLILPNGSQIDFALLSSAPGEMPHPLYPERRGRDRPSQTQSPGD